MRARTRLLVIASTALLASSCAAPYMLPNDCTDFCRAQGKKVDRYEIGAQIPIFHPRPNTRCVCEDGD